MPYNGSGGYNRDGGATNWQDDATAGTKIRADLHDQHDQDIANALGNVICRDGQSSVSADIPFSGRKITNLGAPINPTDAATKAYADSIRNFSSAVTMTGTNAAGRIHFTGTGNLGLSFEQTGMSFGVKETNNPVSGDVNRFVWMPSYDYSLTPLMELKKSGPLNFPTSAQIQIADRTVLQLNDGWAALEAPSLYIDARAGDAYEQVIFRDSSLVTRGRVIVNQSDAHIQLDYRNNAGAIQQTATIDATNGIQVGLGVNAGKVLTTGNLTDTLVYNGSSTVNTVFPVGTTVLVNRTVVTQRNSAVDVALDPANSNDYVVGGAGASLAGTWRAAGNVLISTGKYCFNATRTA
jgi:hypothetical protein